MLRHVLIFIHTLAGEKHQQGQNLLLGVTILASDDAEKKRFLMYFSCW